MELGPPVRLVVDAADRVGAVIRAVLPVHARRRGVVVVVHGRGPAAPWCPSDATIGAVVDTTIELGVAARWAAVGRMPTTLGKLDRLAGPDADRRTLTVRLDDVACELPRAWVGRHALLLAPAVLDADADGPITAALAALAVAARTSGAADPVAVGASIVAQVFAGFTWVLDAERSLQRSRRGAKPRAFVVSRCFVHGATGLDAAEVRRRARTIDAWAQRRQTGGLELVGAQADDPWPQGPGEALGVDGTSWSTRPRAREARRP